jgi:hypothetical protein
MTKSKNFAGAWKKKMTIPEILKIIILESSNGCIDDVSTWKYFEERLGVSDDVLERVKVLAKVLNFEAIREQTHVLLANFACEFQN